jgi:tetratricopeptide (TPR) repeat protein/tRNA A-37 threonylcarbamoyl transferase component Bud32
MRAEYVTIARARSDAELAHMAKELYLADDPDRPLAEPGQSDSGTSEVLQTGFAPRFPSLLQTSGPVGDVLAAAPEPAEPGKMHLPRVAGYEIEAELGRGGMGVVYKARQRSLKRLVAIKMLLTGLQADPSARQRFRTEAEAVARLQHPNIVQIHEVGEQGGRLYFALEYVEGGALLERSACRPQPPREAAELMETLARAVHYMHERCILHRDLKPSNVLMAADGTPKITDFGLAKLLDTDAGLTRSETLLGTPIYMAPEQATGGTKKVGRQADVYSLGAILYELLTGRPPFHGATVLGTLEQVRNLEPLPPRRWCRAVSRDLETICLKCLEKQPGRRYQTAETVADDLRRFLDGQPIQARPVPAWQRLWRSAWRRPARLALALAALAIVVLSLTAWSLSRVAGQLAPYRAEAKYREFVQRRNEALVYGLLGADQASLSPGAETAASVQAAQAAAIDALALAGIRDDSATTTINPEFPAARRAEVAADCYTLLLVLASIHAREPSAGQPSEKTREESLRTLDRACALGFVTRAYYLRRADLLEQIGELRQAQKDRDRAACITPDDALDHFLLGEELYRQGDWARAMNFFGRALAVRPDHFWSQYFLAVCHLKMQQWQAAKAGLNACLTQQPDFVWAYLFRSFANERLQALPEAHADFQKALELRPNEDAHYGLLLTRGILFFGQHAFEHAAADFRAAQFLKPRQWQAYLDLAHIRLVEEQFDEADRLLKKALDLGAPTLAVAGYHLERGRCCLRSKSEREALDEWTAALELAPQLPLPHELRGRALLALGDYEQAEKSFDEYLRLGGEQNTDVFRGRGRARMKLRKFPEAVEDYSRVLAAAPDAEIYEHRGWAHFFADAWKLALRDFSRAVELDPRADNARTGRGLARAMLGDYRQAVADAEEALRQKPGTPEMMHNIACVFARAVACAEADVATAPPATITGRADKLNGKEDRQRLAESYRRRAVEAVRQTLAMVPSDERSAFWRDKIYPDPALAPIRNIEDFKRIAAAFDQR